MPRRNGSLLLATSLIIITLTRASVSFDERMTSEKHIILPSRERVPRTKHTLRQFLAHKGGFHLALAPAFFGFYGYFGVLASWVESFGPSFLSQEYINSVAGASAGAIAAVLISAGIPPQRAVEFCRSLTLDQISDFPGIGAVFRGHRVEALMQEFLENELPGDSLLLEDGKIPVAVTGFDLSSMEGKVLSKGSMARAARASATFPGLFQPISWTQDQSDYMLVDGGLADLSGMAGLSSFVDTHDEARVVNIQIGSFMRSPPGPSTLPGQNVTVLSISIQGLPMCGPWALHNGPIAVEAAQQAMAASLDTPLFVGKERNHFELHIDAKTFWK